jgi:hypothetical protein
MKRNVTRWSKTIVYRAKSFEKKPLTQQQTTKKINMGKETKTQLTH